MSRRCPPRPGPARIVRRTVPTHGKGAHVVTTMTHFPRDGGACREGEPHAPGQAWARGTRVRLALGALAPLSDEEYAAGLSLSDARSHHRYPGTVESEWEDGWTTLVRFDGDRVDGDITGCTLLVENDDLERLE